LVDKRRFAVVDMGDNGDIADIHENLRQRGPRLI
jgi:hypothetical protein